MIAVRTDLNVKIIMEKLDRISIDIEGQEAESGFNNEKT